MKRLPALVLAVLCVLFVLAGAATLSSAAAEPPNLAGKWRPDLQRSTSEKTLKPAANDPNAVAPPAPTPAQAGHPAPSKVPALSA